MLTIYHNPRCSKSRQGLQMLEDSGKPFQVVEYLTNVPTVEELSAVIEKLGIKAEDLIRKNEADYKEYFKGKTLSDKEWIEAMIQYPQLIERPIVVTGNKAVIGRPTEKIADLIK
jgi:arsenate reductase (glutaredoxin)